MATPKAGAATSPTTKLPAALTYQEKWWSALLVVLGALLTIGVLVWVGERATGTKTTTTTDYADTVVIFAIIVGVACVLAGASYGRLLERGQLAHGSQGRTWLDGVLFDITDRRLAEEALREREAQQARLAEVEASRARIVDAADAARRRLERDLHDGAQQRLVALALNLRLVRDRLDVNVEEAVELLDRSRTELDLATTELRELARGLHPPVLTDRGLGPALRSLGDRMPVVVELSVEIEDRLPAPVETAAYFMVAEALTNVVKHAQASLVRVTVVPHEGRLVVEVSDDGVGGAAPGEGSGLSGLRDRVEALDGRLDVQSARGRGTAVRATIPCPPAQRPAPAEGGRR